MISVVMATYNGEKYVSEQINSIICQLGSQDELIITDDGSVDNTCEIIKQFALQDDRIRLLSGAKQGVIRNFESALLVCKGTIIFLCDQDDVWRPDKMKSVLDEFAATNAMVVVHDAAVTDRDLKVLHPSFMLWRGCRHSFLGNVFKNSFMGCCMAFRKELLTVALPFPRNIPMHDQWLGLIGYRFGKVQFMKDSLIMHRRHDQNASSTLHAKPLKMMVWRFHLLWSLFARTLRGYQPLKASAGKFKI